MHYHLIGICGTAMASLAGMLQARGHHVTGSDQNVYPPMSTMLRDLGINVVEGFKRENLTPAPDCVIVGLRRFVIRDGRRRGRLRALATR